MGARRPDATFRRHAWPLLAAALALVPFYGAFSRTHVFYVRDLGLYFWPRHLWLWQTVREGDWPFWDPYAGGGQSAVADALHQFFLLPVTIVRLLPPPVVGFNFWVAAPPPILALGMWMWLRRRFPPAASAVGASVVSLAGPVVSAGNFPNLSWTLALVPWILWSVDRLGASAGSCRVSVVALLVALQAMAGEPVTFAATCAVTIGYGLLALPGAAPAGRRTAIVSLLLALGAGVLLAAVQLVPLVVAASRSTRGLYTDINFWSLHPLALLETIVPHLFGNVYHASLETLPWVRPLNAGREPLLFSLYVGVAACGLALVRHDDPALHRWRRFWWIVAVVFVVAALGEHTFLYPLLQEGAPVLKRFRFPVKYVEFTVLALSALAAAGADALIGGPQRERVLRRPQIAVVTLATVTLAASTLGILGLVGGPTIWESVARSIGADNASEAASWLRGGSLLWIRLAALAMFTALMVSLAARRDRLSPIAAWAVCGLAIADPLSVNIALNPTMPASRLGPPEWREETRAHANDRVYVGGRIGKVAGRRQMPAELLDSPTRFDPPADMAAQEAITIYSTRFAVTPAAWRIRELISYDLPQLWPREYTAMLSRFRRASPAERLLFLRRTGHRYCFVPEPPFAGAQPLAASAIALPMALYECHDVPRRVYLTAAAQVEPDVGRQLDLLFRAEHDPFQIVLLHRMAPAADGQGGTPASQPSAEITRERNTELIVRATVPAAGGYLNVIDSYDPFWIVEVDGRRGTLLRANGLFRAVHLAPGTHIVRFAYRPLPLYAGLAITSAAALSLALACWRRRRPLRDNMRR